MRKVKRIRLLLEGMGAIAVIPYVRAAGSAAQFSYKLGHNYPVEAPIHVRAVQMANAIKTETNGRVELGVFPNNQLGGTAALVELVRLGPVQFLISGDSAFAGISPVYALDNLGYLFSTWQQCIDTMAGPLGAYLRKDLLAKGLRAFEIVWAAGFAQLTTSTKPVRTVDDLAGLKIRVPLTPIVIELFKTLGAVPIGTDAGDIYPGLQTHLLDATELPLGVIEQFRLFEVQKYLSITNDRFGANSFVGNPDAWNALPADIQAVVDRNARKYARLQNNDSYILDKAVGSKLQRQGMTVNTADSSGMRARLSPYYARWKKEFGSTVWGLLEASIGTKLG